MTEDEDQSNINEEANEKNSKWSIIVVHESQEFEITLTQTKSASRKIHR